MLRAGEEWQSPDAGLRLSASQIIDFAAPCPPDGRCVWTGVVRQLVLDIKEDDETTSVRLNERGRRTFGDYQLEVLHIEGSEAVLLVHPVDMADDARETSVFEGVAP